MKKSPLPKPKTEQKKKVETTIVATRVGFVLFLMGLSALFGYLAYTTLESSERSLAEEQYTSIVNNAFGTTEATILRKSAGAKGLADLVGAINPNAEEWPFVAVDDYVEIAERVIEVSTNFQRYSPIHSGGFSNTRVASMLPIVLPEQLDQFETHAYAFYDSIGLPPFTGYSPLGPGVWQELAGVFSRPTNGESLFNASPNKIITPLFEHTEMPYVLQMANLHYYPGLGDGQDRIIACDRARNNGSYTGDYCGDLGDVFRFREENSNFGIPGSYLQEPIYPYNNRTELVGFIGVVVWFEDLFSDVFSESVSGLNVVISSGSFTCGNFLNEECIYTYTIENGLASLTRDAEGDFHDHNYNKYERTVDLNTGESFGPESTIYTVSIYPTGKYFDTYTTTNPLVATIGAVCIMLVTSLVFFLYDYFVRKAFEANKAVLEAKRKFMRFISHEVRTPLNTVSMGLRLLADEMKNACQLPNRIGRTASSISSPRTASIASNSSASNRSASNRSISVDSQESAGNIVEWMSLTEECHANAQSAVKVLNDLLNYDKIEDGTLNLDLAIISMWELIETTVTEFRLQAKKAKVKLLLDYGEVLEQGANTKKGSRDVEASRGMSQHEDVSDDLKVLRVPGDVVRLAQVLRNLISNALKFTPENGTVQTSVSFINDSRANRITKEFTLGNKQKYTGTCHGYIQLCVTDSGVGLSPEQVSKMFGQGVQFNQNLLQGGNGSGLGLYIAKGIVEQHEGSLEVSSEGLGKGTTFTLIIPVYKFEGYVAYAPRHSSISSDFSRHLSMDRPLRLLIVDDAASNRKMLKRILNMRKHICDEAQDGNEAVLKYMTSEFHKQPYDAVLMDNEMPEMDGPTAAKEMRDLGCQYLIVGITGNVLPEDVEAFIAAGADQVLPKPLQMSDLENTFKNYLKKRRVPLTEEQQNRRLKYLQRHIPSDDESSYREISMREQGQDAAEVGKVEVDEKEKNANFLSTISTHDSERFYKPEFVPTPRSKKISSGTSSKIVPYSPLVPDVITQVDTQDTLEGQYGKADGIEEIDIDRVVETPPFS